MTQLSSLSKQNMGGQNQNCIASVFSSSHCCSIARSWCLLVTPVRPWRSFFIAPGRFLSLPIFCCRCCLRRRCCRRCCCCCCCYSFLCLCLLLFHAWSTSPPSRNYVDRLLLVASGQRRESNYMGKSWLQGTRAEDLSIRS